ncbi:MAG: hypothetical protein U0T84_02560 [Chitinophagales bacterium]
MKKARSNELDFQIDKLTNSIVNVVSGDSFDTHVTLLTNLDLKLVTKKAGWLFNWRTEFNNPLKEVYKLTIVNSPNVVQGLISLTIESDHVFMNLLESAPFNLGKNKVYQGVSGNLVAFACKLSFQRGFEGFVAFDAKTALISHYEHTLGAFHYKGQRMIIRSKESKILTEKYFKY